MLKVVVYPKLSNVKKEKNSPNIEHLLWYLAFKPSNKVLAGLIKLKQVYPI